MSMWTHSICDMCWIKDHPDRIPVRLKGEDPRQCCFCGKEHTSGIFTREDPQALSCKGLHRGGG